MRLAEDHIEITLGGESITLRPTLRCGLRLERREGSFAKLIKDLQEGGLTAARFVLSDHSKVDAIAILDAGIIKVCSELLGFVLQCAAIDPDPVQLIAENDATATPSVSFQEHLLSLYRIATGWLGWTPETALNSTPAEIIEAYKGRIEMLKAIFGGDEQTKPKPEMVDLADRLRSAFRELGAKPVARKRKA